MNLLDPHFDTAMAHHMQGSSDASELHKAAADHDYEKVKSLVEGRRLSKTIPLAVYYVRMYYALTMAHEVYDCLLVQPHALVHTHTHTCTAKEHIIRYALYTLIDIGPTETDEQGRNALHLACRTKLSQEANIEDFKKLIQYLLGK